MPEIVTHHFYSQKVLSSLSSEIRNHINGSLYRIGSRGPDPLGIVRFWWLPAWRGLHRMSSEMHNRKSGAFFRKLLEETKKSSREEKDILFSYACGFLTHYFLDAFCHPYIISQTGLGKGTEGNHRSLEHAIDRLFLQEHRVDLRSRPITGTILPKEKLPPAIKHQIDKIYEEVYGWKDAWKTVNHALQDEKRFLRVFEDPSGMIYRYILRHIRNGNLQSLSYSENAYAQADIMNREHRTWIHPYDDGLKSSESMDDLMLKALRESTEAITQVYAYIFQDAEYPQTIGNYSYESGFDTEDPRNQNQVSFSLLPRHGCVRDS